MLKRYLPILRRETGISLDVKESEDVAPSLQGQFKERFRNTTAETIEQICTAERSSTRSQSQRNRKKKRPLVRSEPWSGRLEPEALAALEIAAEHFGESTVSDGIHALAFEFMKQNNISNKTIEDRIDDRAKRREELIAKRKKR